MSRTSIEKAALRARVRSMRLDPADHRSASELVCERLRAVLASARRVMLYAPFGDEVDVWPVAGWLIGLGAEVALPRVDWESKRMQAMVYNGDESSLVRTGPGIRQPEAAARAVATDTLEAVVVPGVAFDPMGGRLGRGGGFYDRLLAEVGDGCRRIGAAFDHQVVETVPREAHDLPMHTVVTPTRTMEAGWASAAGGDR